VLKYVKPPLPFSEPEVERDVVLSASWWHERETKWQQNNQAVAYLTPTLLHQGNPVQGPEKRRQVSQRDSQRLGTLMHRLLQRWNFQDDPRNFREAVADFCQRHLSYEQEEFESDMGRELETLLEHFLESSAYKELQQSIILGREVPFAVPWPMGKNDESLPQTCVMEGVMDVVYEIDGDVWVGDYKTDQVSSSTVAQRAEVYRKQAHAYATAASGCLGLVVKGCKLFFIRIDEVISVNVSNDNFFKKDEKEAL
jgi:ATP-dependent helicase/nuclease subunit A